MSITFYHANQHITSAQCGLKIHSSIIIIKPGSSILYNIQYNITRKHSFQDNLLPISVVWALINIQEVGDFKYLHYFRVSAFKL